MTKQSGRQLTSDDGTQAMPLTDSQVGHLRRLLAWMRVEYMLDSHAQAGYLSGIQAGVEHGLQTPEQAQKRLEVAAADVNRVPAYLRDAIRMLTKALHEHDRATGIVEQKKQQDMNEEA